MSGGHAWFTPVTSTLSGPVRRGGPEEEWARRGIFSKKEAVLRTVTVMRTV